MEKAFAEMRCANMRCHVTKTPNYEAVVFDMGASVARARCVRRCVLWLASRNHSLAGLGRSAYLYRSCRRWFCVLCLESSDERFRWANDFDERVQSKDGGDDPSREVAVSHR